MEISGTGGSERHSPSKALMILLDIFVLCSEISSINQLQVNFSLSIKTSEFVAEKSWACPPRTQADFSKLTTINTQSRMSLIMDLRKNPRQCLQKPTTICRRRRGWSALWAAGWVGGNHAFTHNNVSISMRNRIRAQVFYFNSSVPIPVHATKRKRNFRCNYSGEPSARGSDSRSCQESGFRIKLVCLALVYMWHQTEAFTGGAPRGRPGISGSIGEEWPRCGRWFNGCHGSRGSVRRQDSSQS